jgi:hypothetical protein
VPLSAVEKVTYFGLGNIRLVTIHLRERSAFGAKITFNPPYHSFFGIDEPPVVKELRKLARERIWKGVRFPRRRPRTTACTRPPTRRFSCSNDGLGGRVRPGVGLVILNSSAYRALGFLNKMLSNLSEAPCCISGKTCE